MNRVAQVGLMFCFAFVITILSAESFFIEKKKEKAPSISRLKERYAQKSAEVVKQIADVQRYEARVQRILMDDMEAVFEGNKTSCIGSISKENLEKRIKTIFEFGDQIKELKKQLKEVRNSLR